MMSFFKKIIYINLLTTAYTFSLYSSHFEGVTPSHNNHIADQSNASPTQVFPRVQFNFNPQQFVEDCSNSCEIPSSILPKSKTSGHQLCWETLFNLKNYYKLRDHDKYIHTYHVMAKFLLSHGVFPLNAQTHKKSADFISKLIDKIGLGILPAVPNNKIKKWSYIYLSMLTRRWANDYSKNKETRLNQAFREAYKAIDLKTTRTTHLLIAELILDEGFTPNDMSRKEAVDFAQTHIDKAFEKEASKNRSFSKESTDASQKETVVVKHARPLYIHELKRQLLNLSHHTMDDFVPFSSIPFITDSFSDEEESDHTLDADELLNFDYGELVVRQHASIDTLPLRNITINADGGPQEIYVINGRTFRRQNVLGDGMRCFFNAMGLLPEGEIALLKWLQNDPTVRYMIANEIISALAQPAQMPDSVKRAIDYQNYRTRLYQLNRLAIERNTFLAAQNPNPNLTNPDLLPELYHNLDERFELLRENMRKRALSLNAFHAFLNNHIGDEEMMVALYDVNENGINNFTSIDAIAYAEGIGVMIFSPGEEECELNLVHQFIPENASTIRYIYHSGVHFQALNEVNDIDEDHLSGITHNEDHSTSANTRSQDICDDNDEIDSSDHDISPDDLVQMYPDIVTEYPNKTYDSHTIRTILYLKEHAHWSTTDISKKLNIDSKRINEIFTCNGISLAYHFGNNVKEKAFEVYLKFYKRLNTKRVIKKQLCDVFADKINEGRSQEEKLTCKNLLYFFSNYIEKKSIDDVADEDEKYIVESYKSGKTVFDIHQNNKEINYATIIDLLNRHLEESDFHDQMNLHVPQASFDEVERKELIIQTFEHLKNENKGKIPSVLAVTNALQKEKIGYKTVGRILKDNHCVERNIKAKHITPELAKCIRTEYETLIASGFNNKKAKESLVKKHGLTLIQTKDILSNTRYRTYNSERTAIIEANRKAVVEIYNSLTTEEQERPTILIKNHLQKKGITLSKESILGHLKKEGLYKSNGQCGKNARNIMAQKRTYKEISPSISKNRIAKDDEFGLDLKYQRTS